MKISKGKYVDQFAIGVTWLRYPNVTWSIIFDFGLWYVEISNEDIDYEPDLSKIFPNALKCDRCGSPNDVYSHVNWHDSGLHAFENVCIDCMTYENTSLDVKNKTNNEPSDMKNKGK